MKTKVYDNVEYGDWVVCTECGNKMLLPCGSDRCPECGKVGCLSWASEKVYEQEMWLMDIDEIENVGRSLNPHEHEYSAE